MQLKHLVIFISTFFFSTIQTLNYDKLILFQPPALTFYNNQPIIIKKNSIHTLSQKWQHRLTKTWKKLLNNIEVQPEQLELYLQDQDVHNLYEKELEKQIFNGNFITEETNPEVETFIKKILSKYCSKKNIKILFSSHLSTPALSLGSNQTTLYLLCHPEVYSLESVEYFYNNLNSDTGIFFVEPIGKENFNIIEKSNFLLIKLIEAAMHLQHESHLMIFLLSCFKLPNNPVPPHLVATAIKLIDLRGQLETILQSKNPLETALFMAQSSNKTKFEHKLWQGIITEIADCYHPYSIQIFKQQLLAAKT